MICHILHFRPPNCLIVAALWLLPLCWVDIVRASEPTHGDPHATSDASTEEEASDSPIRGVSLGEFSIRAYYPIEAKRSTVTFTLYAIVPSENSADFRSLLEHRTHKVRDQVITATRLVPLSDFDDPKLRDFRRRIMLRLRRTMSELIIDDLYVSDFHLEVRGI
jgi:hypothetical protein